MNRVLFLFAVVGSGVLMTPTLMTAAEATTEDYMLFMKPLTGSWKTTSETDGQATPGTISYQLASNEHCFLGHYEGILPDVQSIEGYDPVAKKHTVVGFGRDGSHAIATVDWGEYLQPGKTLRKGVNGKQSLKLFFRDGKTLTATATVTCTALEQDKVVLEYSDRIEGGKALPRVTMTWERQ